MVRVSGLCDNDKKNVIFLVFEWKCWRVLTHL